MADRIDHRPPWADLAGWALTHEMAGRGDIAHDCVRRIVELHGPDVIPQVLLAWADAAISRAWPDGLSQDGQLKPLTFLHAPTGEIGGADEVPAPVRWAGRFIMARLVDDEPQALALLATARSDREWSVYVGGVLNVAAQTILVAGGVR